LKENSFIRASADHSWASHIIVHIG